MLTLGMFAPVVPATPAHAEPASDSSISQATPCLAPAVICKVPLRFGIGSANSTTALSFSLPIKSTLQMWFQSFDDEFNATRAKSQFNKGLLPIVTWTPGDTHSRYVDKYSLANIASGKMDSYIRRNAQAIKASRVPVIIRFGHEMNGFWYPWGQPRPGDPRSNANAANTPEKFVAAYRHMHDVFKKARVTNAFWMWSPDVMKVPNVSLQSLYPGDSYVDVVGLTSYITTSKQDYYSIYQNTLNELDSVAPQKSIIVAEAGVSRLAQRPELIRDLLEHIASTPRVIGFFWLSVVDGKYDYTLANDPDSIKAIQRALMDTAFTAAQHPKRPTAENAKVFGPAQVGAALQASGTYRGTVTSAVLEWYSCPTATSAVTDCSLSGSGSQYVVTSADWHRYFRANVLLANGQLGSNVLSNPVGPVLNNGATEVLGQILTSGSSLHFVFATSPLQRTQRVIQMDGGPLLYQPLTTTDYWLSGLTPGSTHTYKVFYTDIMDGNRSDSPAVTGTIVLPMKATIVGEALVGSTLTTSGVLPTGAVLEWYSCPTALSEVPDCVLVANGSQYVVTSADWHRYVRVNLTVTNQQVGSSLLSNAVGPVLNNGLAPVLGQIATDASSAHFVFTTSPLQRTQRVIQIDGGSLLYQPLTATDYWQAGLALGSTHTYTVFYTDIVDGHRTDSPAETGTFVPLGRPTAPTYTVAANILRVVFPTVQTGQTGWCYRLNDGPTVTVDVASPGVDVTVASQAVIAFSLQASGGTSCGPAVTVSFWNMPAPSGASIDIFGRSARLNLPQAPDIASNFVLTIDGQAPTYAPKANTSIWLGAFDAGSTHTYVLRYGMRGASTYWLGQTVSGQFTVGGS